MAKLPSQSAQTLDAVNPYDDLNDPIPAQPKQAQISPFMMGALNMAVSGGGQPEKDRLGYAANLTGPDAEGLLKGRNPQLVQDLRNYYSRVQGKTFESDDDVLDKFLFDRTFNEGNFTSFLVDAYRDSKVEDPTLKDAVARIRTFDQALPGWQMGVGKTLGTFTAGMLTDPTNFIPFGGMASKALGIAGKEVAGEAIGQAARMAGKGVGEAAWDAAKAGFSSTAAKQEAIDNAVIGGLGSYYDQKANVNVGLQDSVSPLDVAGGALAGAAIGRVAGGIMHGGAKAFQAGRAASKELTPDAYANVAMANEGGMLPEKYAEVANADPRIGQIQDAYATFNAPGFAEGQAPLRRDSFDVQPGDRAAQAIDPNTTPPAADATHESLKAKLDEARAHYQDAIEQTYTKGGAEDASPKSVKDRNAYAQALSNIDAIERWPVEREQKTAKLQELQDAIYSGKAKEEDFAIFDSLRRDLSFGEARYNAALRANDLGKLDTAIKQEPPQADLPPTKAAAAAEAAPTTAAEPPKAAESAPAPQPAAAAPTPEAPQPKFADPVGTYTDAQGNAKPAYELSNGEGVTTEPILGGDGSVTGAPLTKEDGTQVSKADLAPPPAPAPKAASEAVAPAEPTTPTTEVVHPRVQKMLDTITNTTDPDEFHGMLDAAKQAADRSVKELKAKQDKTDADRETLKIMQQAQKKLAELDGTQRQPAVKPAADGAKESVTVEAATPEITGERVPLGQSPEAQRVIAFIDNTMDDVRVAAQLSDLPESVGDRDAIAAIRAMSPVELLTHALGEPGPDGFPAALVQEITQLKETGLAKLVSQFIEEYADGPIEAAKFLFPGNNPMGMSFSKRLELAPVIKEFSAELKDIAAKNRDGVQKLLRNTRELRLTLADGGVSESQADHIIRAFIRDEINKLNGAKRDIGDFVAVAKARLKATEKAPSKLPNDRPILTDGDTTLTGRSVSNYAYVDGKLTYFPAGVPGKVQSVLRPSNSRGFFGNLFSDSRNFAVSKESWAAARGENGVESLAAIERANPEMADKLRESGAESISQFNAHQIAVENAKATGSQRLLTLKQEEEIARVGQQAREEEIARLTAEWEAAGHTYDETDPKAIKARNDFIGKQANDKANSAMAKKRSEFMRGITGGQVEKPLTAEDRRLIKAVVDGYQADLKAQGKSGDEITTLVEARRDAILADIRSNSVVEPFIAKEKQATIGTKGERTKVVTRIEHSVDGFELTPGTNEIFYRNRITGLVFKDASLAYSRTPEDALQTELNRLLDAPATEANREHYRAIHQRYNTDTYHAALKVAAEKRLDLAPQAIHLDALKAELKDAKAALDAALEKTHREPKHRAQRVIAERRVDDIERRITELQRQHEAALESEIKKAMAESYEAERLGGQPMTMAVNTARGAKAKKAREAIAANEASIHPEVAAKMEEVRQLMATLADKLVTKKDSELFVKGVKVGDLINENGIDAVRFTKEAGEVVSPAVAGKTITLEGNDPKAMIAEAMQGSIQKDVELTTALKEGVDPATVSPVLISNFQLPAVQLGVPDGYKIAVRYEKTGGKGAGGTKVATLADADPGMSADQLLAAKKMNRANMGGMEIGYVPADAHPGALALKEQFIPLGSPAPKDAKVGDAAKMVTPDDRPKTMGAAYKTEIPANSALWDQFPGVRRDGIRTVGDLIERSTALQASPLGATLAADPKALASRIAEIIATEQMLAKLLPRTTGNFISTAKKTSTEQLSKLMAGWSHDEQMAMMSVMDRLAGTYGPQFKAAQATIGQADAMPMTGYSRSQLIEMAKQQFGTKTSDGNYVLLDRHGKETTLSDDEWLKKVTPGTVFIDTADVHPMTPRAFSTVHEIGHWSYFNLLTAEERAAFWTSLQNHLFKDGKPNYDGMKQLSTFSEAESMHTLVKGDEGKFSPQEFFANQFAMYAMRSVSAGAETVAEHPLHGAFQTFIKKIAAFFQMAKAFVFGDFKAFGDPSLYSKETSPAIGERDAGSWERMLGLNDQAFMPELLPILKRVLPDEFKSNAVFDSLAGYKPKTKQGASLLAGAHRISVMATDLKQAALGFNGDLGSLISAIGEFHLFLRGKSRRETRNYKNIAEAIQNQSPLLKSRTPYATTQAIKQIDGTLAPMLREERRLSRQAHDLLSGVSEEFASHEDMARLIDAADGDLESIREMVARGQGDETITAISSHLNEADARTLAFELANLADKISGDYLRGFGRVENVSINIRQQTFAPTGNGKARKFAVMERGRQDWKTDIKAMELPELVAQYKELRDKVKSGATLTDHENGLYNQLPVEYSARMAADFNDTGKRSNAVARLTKKDAVAAHIAATEAGDDYAARQALLQILHLHKKDLAANEGKGKFLVRNGTTGQKTVAATREVSTAKTIAASLNLRTDDQNLLAGARGFLERMLNAAAGMGKPLDAKAIAFLAGEKKGSTKLMNPAQLDKMGDHAIFQQARRIITGLNRGDEAGISEFANLVRRLASRDLKHPDTATAGEVLNILAGRPSKIAEADHATIINMAHYLVRDTDTGTPFRFVKNLKEEYKPLFIMASPDAEVVKARVAAGDAAIQAIDSPSEFAIEVNNAIRDITGSLEPETEKAVKELLEAGDVESETAARDLFNLLKMETSAEEATAIMSRLADLNDFIGAAVDSELRASPMAMAFAIRSPREMADLAADGMVAHPHIQTLRNIARGATGAKASDHARDFHRLQMRRNSDRLRATGHASLADFIGGFFPARDSALARDTMPLFQAVNALEGSAGPLKRWFRNSFETAWSAIRGSEVPQPDSHARIANALDTGDFDKLKSHAEVEVATKIRDKLRSILQDMKTEGIIVGDISKVSGGYFPHIWDVEKLRLHRDEFINKMSQWFLMERRRVGGEAISEADATQRATAFWQKVIDRDDGIQLPGELAWKDGGSDHLSQRKIAFSGPEFAALGMDKYMVRDLNGVLAKYLDGVTRRRMFNRAFGNADIGFHDYMHVASFGTDGAAELLTKSQVIRSGYRLDAQGYGAGVYLEQVAIPVVTHDMNKAKAIAAQAGEIAKTGDRQAVADFLRQFYPEGGRDTDVDARTRWIANALVEFGPEGKPIRTDELRYIYALFDTFKGKPLDTGAFSNVERHVARKIANFNAMTTLGFSMLTSIPDLAMPLMRGMNFGAYLKGMKELLTNPEYRAAVQRIGVSIEDELFHHMQTIHGVDGGQLTTAFFHANGLTPWTKAMRNLAGIVAFETFKAEQAIALRLANQGKTNSVSYRRSSQFLKNFGLGDFLESGAPAIDSITTAEGNDALRQAILKFANESIFNPNKDEMPLWSRHPVYHLAMQLKSYSLMYSRMAKRIMTERPEVGAAMLFGVAPMFGMAASAVKDIVQGRGGDDQKSHEVRKRSLEKIAKDLGLKDYRAANEVVDAAMGWYVEGLLAAGGLGLFTDILYNTAAAADNGAYGFQRWAGAILGPTVGTAVSGWNILGGVMDTSDSNAKERTAVREATQRMIPIIGGSTHLKEFMADHIAGPAAPKGGGSSHGWGSGFGGGWGSKF